MSQEHIMEPQHWSGWANAAIKFAAALEAKGITLDVFQHATSTSATMSVIATTMSSSQSSEDAGSDPMYIDAITSFSAWEDARSRRYFASGGVFKCLNDEEYDWLCETVFRPYDGTLESSAVNREGEELKKLASLLQRLRSEAFRLDVEHMREVASQTGDMRHLDDFEPELSVRAYNILRRQGAEYLASLQDWSETDLLNLRNMGTGSVGKIQLVLAAEGYSLKPSPIN